MAFVGSIGHTRRIFCSRHQDAEHPATARTANDQSRASMVEADAVFAQGVAPSGTLWLWLVLVPHAQAAQRDTGKRLRRQDPAGPEASTGQ